MVTTQFLLFFFLSLSITTISMIPDADMSVMKDLLTAVTPTPATWSSDTHFCEWSGVECDSVKRVISLNLASQSLSGTLPVSLSSLSRLASLHLEKNSFSGTLPSLANLTSLWDVQVYENLFTSIPTNAFYGLINLQYFAIANNTKLAPWHFPTELINSTKLVTFYAKATNMMGAIPDLLESFPALLNVSLAYNNLTGSLPISLKGSAIQNLWLQQQDSGLTGSIDVLCGMDDLSSASLNDNHFTGIIPPCLFSLPHLKCVTLQNNSFQGPSSNFKNKDIDHASLVEVLRC